MSLVTDTGFSQAVVFVIGGGSFNEYNNLLEYAKVLLPSCLHSCDPCFRDVIALSSSTRVAPSHVRIFMLSFMLFACDNCSFQVHCRVVCLQQRKAPLDIVYGSTELCRPVDFLSQLSELGSIKAR